MPSESRRPSSREAHTGCSRFAVKAGAKHVIGVDMSTIIFKAREIVAKNGMSDKITLIQGKMEEIELPFPKVDIIISEWMGYFLLYESMLDTVLYARDRYLNKDGLIFPDKATIFMCGIEDGDYKEEKIGCRTALPSLRSCQLGIILTMHARRSLGQRLWIRLHAPEGDGPRRAPRRHGRGQGGCHGPDVNSDLGSLHVHRGRPGLLGPLQALGPA